MGTLKEWVTTWDQRIAEWIAQGPDCDMGLGCMAKAYRGNEHPRTALQMRALPEPYVGDPLSTDLDAVLLMLNPGGSGCEQWHPDGCLVNQVRSDYYSAVASHWGFPPKTTKWWSRRWRWATRFMGLPAAVGAGKADEKPRIVGIDLLPWHSNRWGKIDVTGQAVLEWCRENVLLPAAEMAAESRLRKMARGVDRPVVLAMGKQHAEVLCELGFRKVHEVNQRTGRPDWPRKGPGGPLLSRNLRLFVSDDPPLAVLQTDAQGAFGPPAQGFDPIVREILGIPEPGR